MAYSGNVNSAPQKRRPLDSVAIKSYEAGNFLRRLDASLMLGINMVTMMRALLRMSVAVVFALLH